MPEKVAHLVVIRMLWLIDSMAGKAKVSLSPTNLCSNHLASTRMRLHLVIFKILFWLSQMCIYTCEHMPHVCEYTWKLEDGIRAPQCEGEPASVNVGELHSSGGAAHALNHWAISPASNSLLLTQATVQRLSVWHQCLCWTLKSQTRTCRDSWAVKNTCCY